MLHPYRRRQPRGPGNQSVMTNLAQDALIAVRRVSQRYGISISGAVHHLVRLGAGLPPLIEEDDGQGE